MKYLRIIQIANAVAAVISLVALFYNLCLREDGEHTAKKLFICFLGFGLIAIGMFPVIYLLK